MDCYVVYDTFVTPSPTFDAERVTWVGVSHTETTPSKI